MPMVIYSLFEQHDFAGKTVIPFTTHGGSRLSAKQRLRDVMLKRYVLSQQTRSLTPTLPDQSVRLQTCVELWKTTPVFSRAGMNATEIC